MALFFNIKILFSRFNLNALAAVTSAASVLVGKKVVYGAAANSVIKNEQLKINCND